jgi:hypothetical protein
MAKNLEPAGKESDRSMLDSISRRILSVELRTAVIHETVAARRVQEARRLFRDLKVYLNAAYRKMDGGAAEARLSLLEQKYYRPFIADAWTESGISSVRWNSDPSKWEGALSGVSRAVVWWSDSVNRASGEK